MSRGLSLFSEEYIPQFYDSLFFFPPVKIQHFGFDSLVRLHLIVIEIQCDDSCSGNHLCPESKKE